MKDSERIAYLKRIIKESPNTPKARNAKWLIKEIQNQQKWVQS